MTQAESVIGAQIEALEKLRGSLNPSFAQAIDLIFDHPGKAVVTGMGKAGLIGQKISATLRSTGQPSVFLDPAQALHGDMGMLARGDCLIALSNSGETDEVLAVCQHCTAHGIAIIAITQDRASPLVRASDLAITYPVLPEGCPIGRAPMASTLMMLVIGDAIAAELMVRRNFTEQDFLALHHGGYLGRQIAEVVRIDSK